jgi:Fe-S-cluster formation regulator IscX/YfhJ
MPREPTWSAIRTIDPRRMRKVDLRKLLHQVETALSGSPELDSEFVREQILNPHNFVGDR